MPAGRAQSLDISRRKAAEDHDDRVARATSGGPGSFGVAAASAGPGQHLLRRARRNASAPAALGFGTDQFKRVTSPPSIIALHCLAPHRPHYDRARQVGEQNRQIIAQPLVGLRAGPSRSRAPGLARQREWTTRAPVRKRLRRRAPVRKNETARMSSQSHGRDARFLRSGTTSPLTSPCSSAMRAETDASRRYSRQQAASRARTPARRGRRAAPRTASMIAPADACARIGYRCAEQTVVGPVASMRRTLCTSRGGVRD